MQCSKYGKWHCVCVCVGLNYFFEMNEKQGAGVNVFSLMCRNTHTNFRQHIQRILFKAPSPIVFCLPIEMLDSLWLDWHIVEMAIITNGICIFICKYIPVIAKYVFL